MNISQTFIERPIATSLLMGAIALFIVLAVVMYVTRKVDWYARDAG